MALSDLYSSHPHFKTRLDLHVRDSKDNVVSAAAAGADVGVAIGTSPEEHVWQYGREQSNALLRRSAVVQDLIISYRKADSDDPLLERNGVELLKTEQVQAIIGPLTSMQANFLVHLGDEAHVPIISFSATSLSLSSLRSPYFFRAALNDSSQIQPITAIIQAFGWKEVVPIYIENEYGEGLIPFLTDTFQESEIRVLYRSTIHPDDDEEIVAELYKLMTMQTRVFIVHMTGSLSARLFTKANEIGMMSEGYVWIITDGITNSLNFFDPSIIIDSMQGVIGVKPHVPKSDKLEDFTSRWKNRLHQEKTSSDLNVFGLWAYDAATALAMAVEKVGTLNLSIWNLAKNSTTNFESIVVSQNGIHICQALSSTLGFRGLSGNFSFVDGQLQSSAFEIVNVIGNGPRGIGFWTPEHGIAREFKFDAVNTGYKDYSTSQANLKAIIWPGDTTYTPKGWVVPTNGKVLRVAVPTLSIFVMAELPYSVPYEFVPFEMPYEEDIFVQQVLLGVASLTTLLTVHQLEPSITDVRELINKGESVGYPKVSFVYDILKRMNFSDSQLKGYDTVEGDLDVAFSNGSIVAAFDEIPYLKLFNGRHCSKYTMVAPIHKTGGFGFVYSLSHL
ncbi:Glutamate receptor 2.2 [Camellia lanceoleosa]|uniref:Glutamate receptor 2.2 n=1 Tax=Camellia lanceoleosa TaxID=1840588 RepID=A0ACC0FGK3_9ERIC|nr:Glutamate receptor 2.2 [Camellia lanceoleosa]